MIGHDPFERDHWDIYAETMDLTIEGHELLAREILCELKGLWRWLVTSVQAIPAMLLTRSARPEREAAFITLPVRRR